MHVTCPSCHEPFPVAAGFLEADGKRLAALLAEMEPVLGRAVLVYLRLFKPAKQGLRTSKAVKLVAELDALVREGSVCRDERTSVRRPASAAIWAQGIEQLLQQTERLTLPLANHHYLRAIVYGIADQADAAAERKAHDDKRAGRHLATAPAGTDAASQRMARQEAIGRLLADFNLKLIDQAEFDRRADELGFKTRERA